MQTIRFLPDRLNSEPVVFRGFTTHEMGLAALAGAGAGLLLSLPFIRLPAGLLFPPACWSCRCCSSGSAAAGWPGSSAVSPRTGSGSDWRRKNAGWGWAIRN